MGLNIKGQTGIAYGIIQAALMSSEIVDSLMTTGDNLSFQEYKRDWRDSFIMSHAHRFQGEEGLFEALEDAWENDGGPSYTGEEAIVKGEYEGVRYQSSWLNDTLHFLILKSDMIVNCAGCSACILNAGDLSSPGYSKTYSIPVNWWNKDCVVVVEGANASRQFVDESALLFDKIIEIIHSQNGIESDKWVNIGNGLLHFDPEDQSIILYRGDECQEHVQYKALNFDHIW